MSFEVDRYSSAWAHIALCADLTWATEPPDEFIIANQRLWAQHCRVSQVLQDAALETQNSQGNNQCDLTTEKQSISSQIQENGSCSGPKHVKDVIPESRLAQFYGNFYYDEAREKCYKSPNEKSNGRGCNEQGCEKSDLTECWMLPEVEYWFRKLVDESAERSVFPRRRRQYRMLADEDFERWGLAGAEEGEAALAARVMAVRGLWAPRPTSPPPTQRKIRARRRQPRRIAALAPPPPAYCIDAPAHLFCDPKCKFKFDPPRPPQLTEHQRAIGRFSASVQAVIRASAARCQPYRGTNVSRYAPTSQRPARHGIWRTRDYPSPRLERFQLTAVPQLNTKPKVEEKEEQKAPKEKEETPSTSEQNEERQPEQTQKEESEKIESPKTQKERIVVDAQQPSTSAAAALDQAAAGLKKRLYSTVLSMSAPPPMNLASAVRLSQKLAPALLKLNPKIVLQSRNRPPNVDHKFEELEKEALEQYKASDESIDTKFRELEKQAFEQYSNSNSNTSCSSGNSAEKKASTSPPAQEDDPINKQPENFPKEKSVTSTQNSPDNTKGQTSSVTNLKNFHTPPRGEKKEQSHRSKNTRSVKTETHRAASDTDETKGSHEAKGAHKAPARSLHMGPKKRHLALCVSDCSSDEDLEETGGCIRDAGPCAKGKMKPSAHGGGDLRPILRKT